MRELFPGVLRAIGFLSAIVVAVCGFYYPIQSLGKKAFLVRLFVVMVCFFAAWSSWVFWTGMAEWASSTFRTEKMLSEFVAKQEAARLDEQKPKS